ncbi:MAG: hypothetical protein ACRDQW_00305 [Haloechinothrix sp.]
MRTVIVRLFESAQGAGEVGMSGFVEDVASGLRQRFTDAQELLNAIACISRGGTPADTAEPRP